MLSYIHQNAVICIHDLAKEAARNLRLFNLPSLRSTFPPPPPTQPLQGSDPNEIDLDCTEESSIVPTASTEVKSVLNGGDSFLSWGIGDLRCHPTILSLFGGSVPVSSSIVQQQQIFDLLVELIYQQNACDNLADVTLESFSQFLCARYQVSHPSHLGVVLQAHTFQDLVSAMQEAAHLRNQSQQLFLRSQFEQQGVGGQEDSSHRKRSEKKVFVQSLRLKVPGKTAAFYSLYEQARQYFSSKSGFAPSLSAIHTYLKGIDSCTKAEPIKNKHNKRSRNETGGNYPTTSFAIGDDMIDIVAEYLFLHLGSTREVSKRYELSQSAQEAAEKEIIDLAEVPPSTEPADLSESSGGKEVMSSAEEKQGLALTVSSGAQESLPLVEDAAFEAKRFVDRSVALTEDLSSFITEISNHELQSILSDVYLPNSGYVASSSLSSSGMKEKELARTVGKVGECIVYRYLTHRLHRPLHKHVNEKLPNYGPVSSVFTVQWLNELEDGRAAYDITVDATLGQGSKRTFVEVKSSRYDENNVFSLSLWEWQFITQLPTVDYHIYRVFSALDKTKTRIVVLKDVRRLVELGRIQLCLAI